MVDLVLLNFKRNFVTIFALPLMQWNMGEFYSVNTVHPRENSCNHVSREIFQLPLSKFSWVFCKKSLSLSFLFAIFLGLKHKQTWLETWLCCVVFRIFLSFEKLQFTSSTAGWLKEGGDISSSSFLFLRGLCWQSWVGWYQTISPVHRWLVLADRGRSVERCEKILLLASLSCWDDDDDDDSSN